MREGIWDFDRLSLPYITNELLQVTSSFILIFFSSFQKKKSSFLDSWCAGQIRNLLARNCRPFSGQKFKSLVQGEVAQFSEIDILNSQGLLFYSVKVCNEKLLLTYSRRKRSNTLAEIGLENTNTTSEG